MTKEAMIKVLRYKAEHIKTKIKPEFFNEVADVLESDEDCIGREAKRTNLLIEDCIRRLPPVKHKVGYWIDTEHYKSYDDGDIITTLLMCSDCKDITEWNTESSHKPYYCENCGAKMIGSQESEG